MSNAVLGNVAAVAVVLLTLLVTVARPGQSMPIVVHNGIWTIAFFLIGTNLARYDAISIAGWTVLTIGILAFNLGYLFGSSDPRLYYERLDYPRSLISKKIFGILLGAYSLGFGGYLLVIDRNYGIATLILDPVSIRGDRVTPYMTMVPLWARLLMFLGPFIFAMVATNQVESLPRILRWLTVGFLGMSMLALLQRTNLFVAILWTMSIVLIRMPIGAGQEDLAMRQRFVRRAYTVFTVAGFVGLTSFQIIARALRKTGEQALSTGAISPLLESSGLTALFHYATSGVVAFGKLVDSTNTEWPPPQPSEGWLIGAYNPMTWGGATFEPALKVIPVIEPWPAISPYVEVPFLTNVYTWYESFYRDFRVTGVLMGMLLVGFVMAKLYVWREISITAQWLGGLLLSMIFLETFATRFNSTLHIVSALVVLAVGWHVRRRGECSPQLRRMG